MNESNAYLILAIMAIIYLLGFLLIPRVTDNERKLQDSIDEHGEDYE